MGLRKDEVENVTKHTTSELEKRSRKRFKSAKCMQNETEIRDEVKKRYK